MRTVYKVFAYIIALGVVIQAMAMVYAVAGLGKWIEDGGVLDKAAFESDDQLFPETIGFAIHAIGGLMIMPLLGLAFLIISLFANVTNGIKMALVTLLLIVIQITLGLFGHGIPALGALHALNAFILFGVAVTAALRARKTTDDMAVA